MVKHSLTLASSMLVAGLLIGAVSMPTSPARADVSASIWLSGPQPVYHGQEYHGWNGDGGNWGDPGNWRGDESGFDFGHGWDSDTGSIVWRGKVDDTVDVYFHGGQWTADVLSGKGPADDHARFYQTLPFNDETVQVNHVDGRGNVYIFQQPTTDNGFTVGVRIHDPQNGSGMYRFALVWH